MKEKVNTLKENRGLLFIGFFTALSCLIISLNAISNRGGGYFGYKELIIVGTIALVFLGITGAFYYFLFKTRRSDVNELYDIETIYFKLPIEIKVFLIFLLDMFVNENSYSVYHAYSYDLVRMLLNPRIITMILIQGVLLAVIYLTIKYVIYIYKKNKFDLKDELLKDSLIYKYWDKTSELYFKGEKIKRVRLIFGVMIIFAAIIGIFSMGFYYASPIMVGGLFLIVLYHILNTYKDLKHIAHATHKMAQGDLNVNIPEKGDVLIVNLAKNINNINKGFKSAVDKELKSEKMKGELITNVSHDLKTPLTSIINYVDLLKDESLPAEKRREYVDILDKKSKRLKVLIEDLFEASKAASGSMELEIEKVDIVALIRQTLGESRDKIDESTLDFKVNLPQEKIYLMLDGKKTWRVFENLINNAIKYSLPGSRVYIDLKDNEDTVLITVKNISAYEMNFTSDEIVERFTRGDASRHTDGSGLGLAISKSIVDLQGGRFDISVDGDLFKTSIVFYKNNNIK